MTTATTAPGMTSPLWQVGLEKQLEAIRLIDIICNTQTAVGRKVVQDHGFDVDQTILKPAVPFVWSKESIQAVLAASQSIPYETKFSQWNLNAPAAWWYFEEPLPFKTLELPEIANVGVRALCFGWIRTDEATNYRGEKTKVEPYSYVGCSAWCDANGRVPNTSITPSQTWVWNEDYNLSHCLQNSRLMHWLNYGPLGKFKNEPQVGIDVFMAACEGLSKFVLAGMAWLDQDILAQSEERLERHRRKDFNRRTGQNIEGVRLVSLRRVKRERTESNGEQKRELSCQFTVDGHWRHQACGPGMKDHKLIWISPYLKGPEDKPFRPSKRKIYLVNR